MKNKKNEKLDYYKLVWIFVLGAIAGWLIELVWFKIKWGEFVYNQGMVYGPFQQIYGFGAIIITLICFFAKNKNKLLIFILSFIICGIFEYTCGLIAEVFFHSYGWNYARVGFDLVIGKYVYLPYCFIWGLFGLIWSLWIYNPLLRFLEKFNNKKMKILAIIVTVFFVFNLLLTGAVAQRKVDRHNNVAAKNAFEKFIDNNYNDEYMKKWIPKIRPIK